MDGSRRGHFAAVEGAALAPDGRWLATASQDRSAVIWELAAVAAAATTTTTRATGSAAGRPVKLLGHTDTVRAVAFAPAGDRLCTVSHDGAARVWALDRPADATAGAGPPWHEVAVLRGHAAAVTSCAFSPAGSGLATVSKDGAVCIHAAAAGTAAMEGAAASPAPAPRRLSRSSSSTLEGGVGGGGGRRRPEPERLWLTDSDSDDSGAGGDTIRDGPTAAQPANAAAWRARVRYEGASLKEGFYRSWDDLTRRQQAELEQAAEAELTEHAGAALEPEWAELSMAAARPDAVLSPAAAGQDARFPPGSGRGELRTASIVHGSRSGRPARRATSTLGGQPPGPTPPPLSQSMAGGGVGMEAWALVTRFAAHGRAVYACAYAQEGQLLATGSTDGEVSRRNRARRIGC